MAEDPPVYRELVSSMAFDPANAPNMEFMPWGLEQTYPPTVSELVGTYEALLEPTLLMEITDGA